MSKITKSAKGKPCYLHLDGCQSGGENKYSVFAHLNGAGMGLKNRHKESGMEWGSACCHNCHQILDGAIQHDYDKEWLELCHLRATIRYQKWLAEEGLIKCK